MMRLSALSAIAPALLLATAAAAQTPPPAAAPPAAAPSKDSLSVYFDSGSASVRAQDLAILDQAARLYRAGQPIVMILTATADPTGSPFGNLTLSQARASAVLRGLVARGIPAERFQILAKGASDLPIPAKPGQDQPEDRQVQIAWR